jgi:symplekin
VNAFKGLIPFLVGLLQKLVGKKIWRDLKLWEGFIRCSTIVFPSSISVLLSLPPKQGAQVVQKSPKLAQAIEDYFKNLAPHHRGTKQSLHLRKLLEDSKMAEKQTTI